MRISILVLDGVFDTGLAALADTLQLAGELRAAQSGAEPLMVSSHGLRKRVTTAQGWQRSLSALPSVPPDVVVVPALGAKSPAALQSALQRRDVAEACALLNRWAQAGTVVAAACTATFVLAHSGLLDGQNATTSWWLGPCFREQFPRVCLEDGRMVVAASGVITAGAALAHFDLALCLVGRYDAALAQTTANYLTFDGRSSQSAYVMQAHLVHADPLVEKFERWARGHLGSFSLAAAARAVRTSERTLERRLQAALGKSPLAYVRDLRVERAVHQLRTTSDTLEEIAASVGYQDAVTLRSLLRRKTGRGVRELRQSASV